MFTNDILASFDNIGVISLPADKWIVSTVKDTVYRSLMMTNRFNGHLRFPYSVMDHSLNVANYAADLYSIFAEDYSERGRDEVFLMGLLHDISESITGDVIYPMKDKLVWNRMNAFEKEFRRWFLEYCYGFNYKWNDELYDKYVNRADRELGVLELIGVSDNPHFISTALMEKLFTNKSGDASSVCYDNIVFLAIKRLENK